MVWMSVVSIGRECNNHLRSDAPDVKGYFFNHFLVIYLIDLPIHVIEDNHSRHSEFLDCSGQLFLANLAKGLETGILILGTEPALLSARSTQVVGLHTLRGIFGKCATHAHRFVVRVREHNQTNRWA